ncbi:four helix bundle protein [Candidatus Poribacteria bacterium]
MRNYKTLGVWQNADELTFQVYRVTRGFPSEEIYGITSQLRRAAYSVPANIAEAEYFLHLANRLDYLSESDRQRLTKLVNYTFAALAGLMKSIRKSQD